MKNFSKPIPFFLLNFTLIFNLLVFWSIRSMWSGIIALTGKPVPYILCLILTLTTLLTTSCCIYKKYPFILSVWNAILNLLFLVLNGYMISVTLDSLPYFLKEFSYAVAFTAIIALCIFLIFYSSAYRIFQKKWLQPVFILTLFAIGFLSVYDISLTNGIDKTPVVYAVEDTYQITFTTQAKGEAWVVIDGVEYNETFSGGRKIENKIHKITVPMEELDSANSYTVYTRAMILHGPYESLQGSTISETYSWKGVNTDDGLHYYVFSDNHLSEKSSAAACSYWGDKLDFLISVGDTANWIDDETELSHFLYLASDITKGEIPVIYARGNHETYGTRFADYHNYVGADNENFYYTFRLQNIWGIVLDMGVDHEDTYVEYAGTAKYDSYRKEQTLFLDSVLENAESEFLADGIDYRIGICHIPLAFSKASDSLLTYKKEWISRLNQMQLSVMYSGHLHDLMFVDAAIEADTILTLLPEFSGKEENNEQYITTGATFPSILVSKRGTKQSRLDTENVFDKFFIGVAASIEKDDTILKYTNESGEIIETISPWFKNVQYGNEIRIKNVR